MNPFIQTKLKQRSTHLHGQTASDYGAAVCLRMKQRRENAQERITGTFTDKDIGKGLAPLKIAVYVTIALHVAGCMQGLL